jgi:hypothetical protein
VARPRVRRCQLALHMRVRVVVHLMVVGRIRERGLRHGAEAGVSRECVHTSLTNYTSRLTSHVCGRRVPNPSDAGVAEIRVGTAHRASRRTLEQDAIKVRAVT